MSSTSEAVWIEAGTPVFRRTRWAMFAAGFAVFATLYYIQPLLPIFAAEFGLRPAESALALSGTTALMAVALLFSGIASDRIGRKRIMVASLLSSGAITLLMALMPDWGGVLACRVALGVSLSGVQAVAMAYLAEEIEPSAFGLSFGLFISGSALGGMVGRLAAALLSDAGGWRLAVAVVGASGLVAGLYVARALPPSRNFRPGAAGARALRSGLAGHLRDPVLWLLFACGFLLMGAFVTSYNYLGFRLLAPPFGLSQGLFGLVFLIYLVGIPGPTLVGAMLARVAAARLLVLLLLLMLAGLALTLSERLPLVIAGLAVLTFGFFSAHSVASGWVSRRAAQGRALAASLYLFFYYQGASALGYAGGLAWEGAGWHGVVMLTGAGTLAALGAAVLLMRATRRGAG